MKTPTETALHDAVLLLDRNDIRKAILPLLKADDCAIINRAIRLVSEQEPQETFAGVDVQNGKATFSQHTAGFVDLDHTVQMTIYGRQFSFQTTKDEASAFYDTVVAGKRREEELQSCRDRLLYAERDSHKSEHRALGSIGFGLTSEMEDAS